MNERLREINGFCFVFLCHQGLSKMRRTHIHFAPGFPKETGVISGMRSSCQLYIFINLEKALEGKLKLNRKPFVFLFVHRNSFSDGFHFFLSSNNVILCPGNDNGILPPEYFRLVQDCQGKEYELTIDRFKKTTKET